MQIPPSHTEPIKTSPTATTLAGVTYTRLLPPPDRSFFLFGMKGIGKFHWIKQTLPDALHIDMEDAKISSRLIPKPELLSHLIQSMRPGEWVVVHELQRIPDLLTHVYPQIAEHGLRFALLSSNIHRLQAERAQDLTSGQINRLNMHPLTPAELGDPWNIDEVLRYGTIAPVWGAEDRQGMLNHVNSSAQLHLREEIRYRITLKVLNGFVQFVPIATRFHAQPLNTSDIAQNYGLTASNVELYIKILEDAMVVTRLAAFNPKKRAPRRESRSKSAKNKKTDGKQGKRKSRKPKRLSRYERRNRPKLYWADPGTRSGIQQQSRPRRRQRAAGSAGRLGVERSARPQRLPEPIRSDRLLAFNEAARQSGVPAHTRQQAPRGGR